MTGTELKPCPFCNSHDASVRRIRDGRQVECPRCHSKGSPAFHGPQSWGSADERAAESWNRRTPTQGDTHE
jgi:hypothetical protein